MSLESDLFEKMRPDTGRLADYGFKKNDNQYILDRMICEKTMKARIIIDESLHISGRVYDDFDATRKNYEAHLADAEDMKALEDLEKSIIETH